MTKIAIPNPFFLLMLLAPTALADFNVKTYGLLVMGLPTTLWQFRPLLARQPATGPYSFLRGRTNLQDR